MCVACRLVTSIIKSCALTARAHEKSLINTLLFLYVNTWQLIECSTGIYAMICFRTYSAPKVRVIKSRTRPFRLKIGLIIGLFLIHNINHVINFSRLLGIIIILRFRLKFCIGSTHDVDKLLEENAATSSLIINGVVICKFPAMSH